MADDLPGVAQGAPDALREALDNSQSLLAMVQHLGTSMGGRGITSLDWDNEELTKLLADQITENRSALAAQPPAAPVEPGELTEQQIIDRERYRCVKLCENWIKTFGDGPDIQYTPAREYATDAINDIIDLITDGQDVAPPRSSAESATEKLATALRALMKIAHYSPASTVQPVAIAREAMTMLIGTWRQDEHEVYIANLRAPPQRGQD